MIRIAIVLTMATLLCSGWISPSESEFTPYPAWNDCTAFCERASTQCDTPSVGEGVMCLMECDVAAQFEGQELTDPDIIAIRDQLICVQSATDCDAVHICLQP